MAQTPQSPASAETSSHVAQPTPVRIQNVVHIVGIEDKPGATEDLVFDEKSMILHTHGHSTAIPLHSILAFSIIHDNKPLIRGTKGKFAQAAPYGVGFAVTITRPSAEILTISYRDSRRAIHGRILVLPKDTENRVVSALSGAGLSPSDYPKTGDLMPSEPHSDQATKMPATYVWSCASFHTSSHCDQAL